MENSSGRSGCQGATAILSTDTQHGHQSRELVFIANPLLHGIPWNVGANVHNRHIVKVLKRQPFLAARRELSTSLQRGINQLATRASTSDWQRAAVNQTPKQVWSQENGLTSYQVWTGYRVATHQLNLHYTDMPPERDCPKLAQCRAIKETHSHIFWECPCAVACWSKLIQHWEGETITSEELRDFKAYCASRQPPPLIKSRKQDFIANF